MEGRTDDYLVVSNTPRIRMVARSTDHEKLMNLQNELHRQRSISDRFESMLCSSNIIENFDELWRCNPALNTSG